MSYRFKDTLNQVFALSKKIDYESKIFLKSKGLTKIEAVYLRMIWENPGITQYDLSKLSKSGKSLTITYVTRLESKGVIRKGPFNNLKRKLYITSKGEEFILEILKAQDELILKMFQGYSEGEIKEYFEMTENIIRNLSNN